MDSEIFKMDEDCSKVDELEQTQVEPLKDEPKAIEANMDEDIESNLIIADSEEQINSEIKQETLEEIESPEIQLKPVEEVNMIAESDKVKQDEVPPQADNNNDQNVEPTESKNQENEVEMQANEPDKNEKADKQQEKQLLQHQQEQQSRGHDNLEAVDGITQSESLGRNRRVRQKNRYFNDFHCIDLTKGRSNREDYESYTASSGSRTSNRRSTTDSKSGTQEEPDVFETKYCRRCSSKTAHDTDGGCQSCLYKKIVESSKRQKPSSQKNRSSANSRQQTHESTSNNQQELSAPSVSRATSSSSSSSSSTSNNGNKRKAIKLASGSKSNGSTSTNISPSNAINDNNNINNNGLASSSTRNKHNNDSTIDDTLPQSISMIFTNSCDPTPSPTTQAIDSAPEASNNNINQDTNSTTNGDSNNDFPRLDTWSPNEVAEYITSKGFIDEAELFKSQSVDGISLLLMQRTDFTYGLKMKLGPALKIYDQVCRLKKEYFRAIGV